jgi:hypothetical protein
LWQGEDVEAFLAIAVLVVLAIVVYKGYQVWLREEEALVESRGGMEASVPPEEALAEATEAMLRRGWALANRMGGFATFTRYEGPNAFTGVVLLLLFVLPGVLYFLLGGRTVAVTIAAYPIEGGSRLVVGSNSNKDARESTALFLDTFPKTD